MPRFLSSMIKLSPKPRRGEGRLSNFQLVLYCLIDFYCRLYFPGSKLRLEYHVDQFFIIDDNISSIFDYSRQYQHQFSIFSRYMPRLHQNIGFSFSISKIPFFIFSCMKTRQMSKIIVFFGHFRAIWAYFSSFWVKYRHFSHFSSFCVISRFSNI